MDEDVKVVGVEDEEEFLWILSCPKCREHLLGFVFFSPESQICCEVDSGVLLNEGAEPLKILCENCGNIVDFEGSVC